LEESSRKEQTMNIADHENKLWLQKLAAEMDSPTIDSERLKFLFETASSVAHAGLLPALYGQPARDARVEERLETLRFLVKLTYEVPDPI
jgi:hypothetical protein